MGAVRLPDALAVRQAADQRERGVGQIIERQQQRRREVAVAGEQHQEPAEQQADRQAADVAEEKLGGRPVEIGKAEHGAARAPALPQCRRAAARRGAERRQRAGDRDDFGDRHPIDAVHEVDEIDEPQAAEQTAEARSIHHGRKGTTRKIVRQRVDRRERRRALAAPAAARPRADGCRRRRRRPP